MVDAAVFPETLVYEVPFPADFDDGQDPWHRWVWVYLQLPLVFLSEVEPMLNCFWYGHGDQGEEK